ncbi:hypothetical protein HK096_002610, partial [Nowakowskiella sp. JEL0078]
MEEGKMETLGIVIVDELHMIGDDSRGFLLELLLTKLRYVIPDRLQIIGMSATLPNISTLATWLNAKLYITDYRPVPLFEFIKVGDMIFDSQFELVRKMNYPKDPRDPDMIVPLVWETIKDGNSVLIFCATREGCEKVTRNICLCLQLQVSEEIMLQRRAIVNELSRTPGGADPTLEISIMKGCAFHHSGLTMEEREIIEDAFRAGFINVLSATSTLASGVNLPARRVIFRTPMIGRSFLDTSSYKQMKGRAGRKGQDTVGESILLCTEREAQMVKSLVQSDLEPVISCLTADQKGMKRALLEIIVNGVASTMEEICLYVKSTLLFAQEKEFNEKVKATTISALKFLLDTEMIIPRELPDSQAKLTDDTNEISTLGNLPAALAFTRLGQATVCSALSPEESKIVFGELQRALKSFVLEDELHIVYQVTPTYMNHEPNWNNFLNIYMLLNETQRRIGDFIGVSVSYLNRAARGSTFGRTSEQDMIHKRFYAALMLNDLVHEVEFRVVMQKFEVNRGTIQSLQSLSSTFAGMVTIFCQKLGWSNLELLIHQFQDRVNFGVEKELVELARVPHVKGFRARILWKAGYRTIASLACASAEEIFEHLTKARPFKSVSEHDVSLLRRIEYRAAHSILHGAQELLILEQQELVRNAQSITKELERVKEKKVKKANSNRKNDGAFTKQSKSSSFSSKSSTSSIPKEVSSPNSIQTRQKGKLESTISPITGQEKEKKISVVKIVVVSSTAKKFTSFVKDWQNQPEFVFHIHSQSLTNFTIDGIFLHWFQETVYYINVNDPAISKICWKDITKVFQQKSRKICINTKQKIKSFIQHGIHIEHTILDPQIAAWCLDPEEKPRTLKQMLNHYLSKSMPPKSAEFSPLQPANLTAQSAAVIKAIASELPIISILMSQLSARLSADMLHHHFHNVEMCIPGLLAQIEYIGVGFEDSLADKAIHANTNLLLVLERHARELAGESFSLASPADVAKILFDNLKLAGDPGSRSTNKIALTKLVGVHPLPAVILEYRRVATLFANHVKPLVAARKESDLWGMMRIHCNYETNT